MGPQPQASLVRCDLQERDRRKEKWAPRWFQPSKDAQTHEDEYSLEDCPMWDFTGDYLKLPRKSADPAGDSYIPSAAQQEDGQLPTKPACQTWAGWCRSGCEEAAGPIRKVLE